MNLSLALDALDTVKRSPHSSLLWQRLCRQVAQLQGDAREAWVQRIADEPFEPGYPEWFRCSVLADLTKNPAWYARQGAQASKDWPADALVCLLGLAWHDALARGPDRLAMVQRLRDLDAPRLQRLIAGQLPAARSALEAPSRKRLRVAIYTPHIANANHGGTLFALNVMSALDETLADIHTFSAQENAIPAIASYHGGNEHVVPVIAQTDALVLKRPGSTDITLPDTQFSLHSRLLQVQQAIAAFAPDVVLFAGFMSPLVFNLYKRYPVLGLSVHALPPLVPVDVWLSADPQADAACWPGLPTPALYEFAFRFWPVGKVTPIDRSALGLADNAVLLISVGYRLETELTPQWHQRMLALLERYPDVHWLLVGVGESVAMESLPRHDRIYRALPQLHPERWLAASDIFVNPPRVGGGGAVALAMEQGLAVAALAGGDAGDKLGPYAARNVDDYFAQLERWITQPQARHEHGQALRARFFERLDFSAARAANGLIAACRQAITSFEQRKEPAGE